MLTLRQVPVWNDNYAYILANGERALVVDAPEADPVLAVAGEMGVRIETLLNTHHHPDHVGSNADLVAATGCTVVAAAHDRERIPHASAEAVVGETISAIGLTFRVLDVRAHTMGHIAYALDDNIDVVIQHGHQGAPHQAQHLSQRPAIFVGDSLFAAGCGRLFEGTPFDLEAAMRTLVAEDERALVVCAHEYTASNLAFATSIDTQSPHDLAIKARAKALVQDMGIAKSSVPSTLETERETNPFLLALFDEPCAAYAKALDVEPLPASVLGALRQAKDHF